MIYSPSQTKQYLVCPTARMLGQEGWISRVVGVRDWVAWIGQGVHAGLAVHYSKKGLLTQAGVLQAGYYAFQAEYEHSITSGRIIPNTFYAVEAKAHIERCLEYAMSYDILPAGFVSACLFSASSLTIFNDCFCFIFSLKLENLFLGLMPFLFLP